MLLSIIYITADKNYSELQMANYQENFYVSGGYTRY